MEKSINDLVAEGRMLPLMEEFYTIQGEGYYKGTAAYFIRVGGCDVGCHWCDVKESWNAEVHPPTSVKQIVAGSNHVLVLLENGTVKATEKRNSRTTSTKK